MSLLNVVLAQQATNRVVDAERRSAQKSIEGDFEGSVAAEWVRFDDDGGGVVTHEGKEYISVILGDKSIKPGTEVELTHANGVYYTNF